MATAETIFQKGTSTGLNFSSITATPYWLPTIYSKKVLSYFRRALVAEAITNTDYYGELSQFGDTVNILTEPTIAVSNYTRSSAITSTIIDPAVTTLTIDRARYFQFEVDDLEAKFSHVNWQSVAASSAAYQLAKAMDKQVFIDILADVKTSSPDHKWGSDTLTGSVTTVSGLVAAATGCGRVTATGTAGVDPLDLLARMGRALDEQEVPEEGRWVVASPLIYEVLAQTASKLMSVDYNQGDGGLRNGLVASGQLRGFKLYKSTALVAGQGVTTNTDAMIAGHMSAVATASALTKVESLRSNTKFADIVRGLLVWGTKVIRPEALVVTYVAAY